MKKSYLIALISVCVIGFAALPAAQADLITFTTDTTGGKPNGWISAESALVSFTDSNGTGLNVQDFGVQSIGKGLEVQTDNDSSILIMNFTQKMQSINMDFGNDDPAWITAGNAVLTLFDGATQVGQVLVAMNLNDIMDQTIAYSGSYFDKATLEYQVSRISDSGGLIEVVDNIEITAAPEPTTLLLLGLGVLGLAGIRKRD